jgi:tRNA G10  N-methylase Trm11
LLQQESDEQNEQFSASRALLESARSPSSRTIADSSATEERASHRPLEMEEYKLQCEQGLMQIKMREMHASASATAIAELVPLMMSAQKLSTLYENNERQQ